MIFQQIRNATIKITYHNKKFLVDPWFANKGSLRSIETLDKKKNLIKNPTVDLPLSINEIVNDIDVCIITHNHIDHFDAESVAYLRKDVKVFVQNDSDKQIMEEQGFIDIELLNSNGTNYEGITIFKTEGQHGDTKERADGPVSGFILSSANEDTLYLCGDTIWYEEIDDTIKKYQPKVIIVNAGDVRYKDIRLLMDLDDIMSVYQNANNSKIIVSHMEAVNHAFMDREDVKNFIRENNMKDIYVPDDGEKYVF